MLVFQEVIRSSTRNQTIIVVLSYQVRVEQYQVRALDAGYLTRTVNIVGGDEVIEKFLRWVKARAAEFLADLQFYNNINSNLQALAFGNDNYYDVTRFVVPRF